MTIADKYKKCMIIAVLMIIIVGTVVAIVVPQIQKSTDDPLVVNIPSNGAVRGSIVHTAWTNKEIYQFLGIPYAEAPSGKLRFKAPEPRKQWENVHDGSSYGKRCPVVTHINTTENGEDLEDCLTLCVYTKNLNAKLPVMFYIYGGGFTNGTHADHPPNYLMEKDIVLVVPQFRLGALGWLSTKTENIPGNMAFMDVLLALQWVQRNINIFGGDPAKVTIFGQSAGAAQTTLLTMSPNIPDGLFNRAIAASGSILAHWINQPDNQAQEVCRAVKCIKCDSVDDIHKCLLNVSVPDLILATQHMRFALTVEDYFGYLPIKPAELAKTYNRKYSVMAGFTKHDGSFVLATMYDAFYQALNGNFSLFTTRRLVNTMFKADSMGDTAGSLRQMMLKHLFHDLESTDLKKQIPSLIEMCNIIWMKSPVLTFLEEHTRSNPNNNYLYTFDYEGEHTRFGYEFGNDWYPFEGGVHHSNDNIYLWSTHDLNPKDTQIAQKMVDLWTSFAITGKPGADGVDIPRYDGEKGPYFHINEEIRISNDALDELDSTVTDPENHKLIRPNVPWGIQ